MCSEKSYCKWCSLTCFYNSNARPLSTNPTLLKPPCDSNEACPKRTLVSVNADVSTDISLQPRESEEISFQVLDMSVDISVTLEISTGTFDSGSLEIFVLSMGYNDIRKNVASNQPFMVKIFKWE